MTKHAQEEYFLLTEKLDEVNWAFEGDCDDIDCDKYLYRDFLKKKYGPVLEHNFSCKPKLKRERNALLRLLSLKKFKRFRYKKCEVCKKELDKLSDSSKIVSFTRPCDDRSGNVEWRGEWTHKKCSKKFKVPEGWKKGL